MHENNLHKQSSLHGHFIYLTVIQWQGECSVHSNACLLYRLLKACGSRLTEKLLEGAPTEDTLVLIERQTGKGPLVADVLKFTLGITPILDAGSIYIRQ